MESLRARAPIQLWPCNSWFALVRRIGFLTSWGWAQHILHDGVSNRLTSPHSTEIDLSPGEFFFRLPRQAHAWCLKNLVVVVDVVVVVFVFVVVVVVVVVF